MCGIHGFTWSDQEKIDKMVELSYKRGPDADGTYVDANISLGHNLLAITEEPEVSSQPWVLMDKWVLCYNGEIYNYKELSKERECIIMNQVAT
jgi:asparagine synthase (glutamine-hydrolysing)